MGKKKKARSRRQKTRHDLTPIGSIEEAIQTKRITLWVPKFFAQYIQDRRQLEHHYKQSLEGRNLKAILCDSFYSEEEKHIPEQITTSLSNPFVFNFGGVCWRFATSPYSQSLKCGMGVPYSIVSYLDSGKQYIVCNVIYDQYGNSRFQVDFPPARSSDEIHWHNLIPGELDHEEGHDHRYDWQICPWFWLAIPQAYHRMPSEEDNYVLINKKYAPDEVLTFWQKLSANYYERGIRWSPMALLLLVIIMIIFAGIKIRQSVPRLWSSSISDETSSSSSDESDEDLNATLAECELGDSAGIS